MKSPNLDLLRSIAVVLVVLSHLNIALGSDSHAASFIGTLGVMVFFVHTSLVLMFSLRRDSQPSAFLLRRAFRVYPLAVVIVGATALAGSLGGAPVPWPQLASNLLLIQNITGHESRPFPLWSLPYELQMYLLLPVLFLFLQQKGLLRILAVAAGALAVIAVCEAAGWSYRLIRYVPCFLPGVLAYVLMHRTRASLPPAVLLVVIGSGTALGPLVVAAGADPLSVCWVFCTVLGIAIAFCREITFGPVVRASSVIATHSTAST